MGRGYNLNRVSTPLKAQGLGNVSFSHPSMNISPYIPKLPTFSGDEPLPKGECIYTEWHFEVKCLLGDSEVTDNSLLQAVRRSLKGCARKMMIPLGELASVADILEKLDAMFGDVSTRGMIMQEFFNAKQKSVESVTNLKHFYRPL